MKKLSERDYEILRARGIMNGFHTSIDFEIPSSIKPKKKSPVNPNVNHELVGKVLHASWGYDMTINDFCKIIEVSPTGKTVVCRMLNKEGFNGFQGDVKSGKKLHGKKFRLRLKRWGDNSLDSLYFIGSYPFCHNSDSKRKGHFGVHNPAHTVYENHMD